MPNTFKVITKAGVTAADVIYTVAGSTTTIVLGLMVANTTAGAITSSVALGTDTALRAENNDADNQPVNLIASAAIPANSSLELMAGNKIVMEPTDTLSVTGTGGAVDVTISVMEMT